LADAAPTVPVPMTRQEIAFPPHLGFRWDHMPELLRERPCAVSIYLPIDPNNRDLRAPDARLRNLIDAAAHRIEDAGQGRTQGKALLASARQFALSVDFMRRRPSGLALLIASDLIRVLDLPGPVGEIVVVGKHFHIKPLLEPMAHNQPFFLLALSRRDVALWKISPFHRERLTLDLPNPELQAEFDSRLAGEMLPAGAEALRKSLLLEDLQRVAASVRQAIGDQEGQLVLAGDPHVTGEFRHVAGQLHEVHPEALQLNPFALDEETLHRRLVALIAPTLNTERDAVLDLARARLGTADPTVAIRFEEILQAAQNGRVDAIVVAGDQAVWGRSTAGKVPQVHGAPKGEDEDLLNVAAVETLCRGGRAFAMPVAHLPRRSAAVATLRF
jgi:Bacterial archaeo-eukaryotic release factor family 3